MFSVGIWSVTIRMFSAFLRWAETGEREHKTDTIHPKDRIGILRFFKDNNFAFRLSGGPNIYTGYGPEMIMDSSDYNYFSTEDDPGSFLEISFPDHLVCIDSYLVKPYKGKEIDYNMRSWKMTGYTIEGKSYVLDERVNNESLSVKRTEPVNFLVLQKVWVNKIRLESTGPCAAGNNYLCLCYLELFGNSCKSPAVRKID